MKYFFWMYVIWNWKLKKLNNGGFWNKSMVIGCCCFYVEEKWVLKDFLFLKCEFKIIFYGGRVWWLIEKFFVIFWYGWVFWWLGIDN